MSKLGIHKLVKSTVILSLLPIAVFVAIMTASTTHPQTLGAEQASLDQRIAQYKATYPTKLTAADEKNIKARCSVVQTNLRNLQPRIASVQTKRNAVYDDISTQLNDLLKKLNNQAFESTKLQENITTLSTKITDYKTSLSNYKQAVDDMLLIDCTQDPTSFKAALETARSNHDKLIVLVGDIRAYITNTVKPSLSQVKVQIESGQTTGGTN